MTDLGDLPTGTVTFLFTDLEGSTAPQQAHPAAYAAALRRHHDLLLGAVAASGGVVFETVGDAVYAAFASPTDAVAASLAGQLALQREDWGGVGAGALRARMGLQTGRWSARAPTTSGRRCTAARASWPRPTGGRWCSPRPGGPGAGRPPRRPHSRERKGPAVGPPEPS